MLTLRDIAELTNKFSKVLNGFSVWFQKPDFTRQIFTTYTPDRETLCVHRLHRNADHLQILFIFSSVLT